MFYTTTQDLADRTVPVVGRIHRDRRALRRADNGLGGCRSADPAEWLAGTVNAKVLANGSHGNPVAAAPGGSAAINVKMGVVKVKSTQTGYLTAVTTTPPAGFGDPGCSTA